MVDGAIVKDRGGFHTLDIDTVIDDGREAARALAARAGLNTP
jgi:hypothetical protein